MQAVVPTGGYATRLRPTSLSMSKRLVPLANRPVMGWVLSQIVEGGVREAFIANVCEKLKDCDVTVVAKAIGMDKRISPYFLNPGTGGLVSFG